MEIKIIASGSTVKKMRWLLFFLFWKKKFLNKLIKVKKLTIRNSSEHTRNYNESKMENLKSDDKLIFYVFIKKSL
jgi:hypothetical protein